MAIEKRPGPVSPADLHRALLESDNPEEAVQALGALEFGQLVLALGRDDAVELLSVASTGQLRALIDLEAWRGDRLDRVRLLGWLRPFEEAGHGRLARAFLALDVELAALLLLEDLRIYLAEDDEEPGDGRDMLPTPDRRVFVEILATDSEHAEQLKNLLDAMFRRDPAASVRALLELRAALPAELEEQAHRWRCARLGDMGFPPLEEALAVYARPAAQIESARSWIAPGSAEDRGRMPVLYAEALAGGSLLASALATLPAEQADELNAAVIVLLNQVLVADRVELADPRGIKESVVAARDLLQLGLLLGDAKSPPAAAELLLERGPRELFRAGYARVAALARRTRALASDGLLAGEPAGDLIDPPGSEVLAALIGATRPRYCCLLDDLPVQARRTFATLEDLARTESALDQAEAACRLVHELLGMPARAIRSLAAECEKQPSLGNAFRTALVRRALGGERFEIDLLSGDELGRFRELAIEGGTPPVLTPDLARQLDEGLEELIAALPERLHDPARALTRGWVEALVEELGALPREQGVDPRFVGGVLVRS